VSQSDADVATSSAICVDVVYVDPHGQVVKRVRIAATATVGEAIHVANISAELPAGFVPEAIGIFGRRLDEKAALREGDRIELYRPLLADPKQARRRRAEKQKEP